MKICNRSFQIKTVKQTSLQYDLWQHCPLKKIHKNKGRESWELSHSICYSNCHCDLSRRSLRNLHGDSLAILKQWYEKSVAQDLNCQGDALMVRTQSPWSPSLGWTSFRRPQVGDSKEDWRTTVSDFNDNKECRRQRTRSGALKLVHRRSRSDLPMGANWRGK